MQELLYDDPTTNNAQSYSGFEQINISPNSPISSAQYQIKQYASAVTISGLEELQNEGKERIIDLLSGRMKIAEAVLRNRISADIYSDGKHKCAVPTIH